MPAYVSNMTIISIFCLFDYLYMLILFYEVFSSWVTAQK